MPKWGLTEKQIQSKPWGIAADWLQPKKQITDPVHGDIFLNKLELAFLDSPPLQRLKRVRQLGMTLLVYPGATHTRLSHSLGSLRAAQDLLDVVIDQRNTSHADPDLFAEWEKLGSADYDRRVAEATVLARLGGLLHDIGHIPFGHTIEDDLGLLPAHDANERRFDGLWAQLPVPLQKTVDARLMTALRPLILSKLKKDGGEEPAEYPFIPDIVGNTICADLLDYLPRDHRYTGLPAKFGRRFVDSFYVTRSDHPFEPQRMVIRIARDGRPRTDVVSELFKYLRYRYELSERVLVHHAKLAADAMLGKLFEAWSDALVADAAVSELDTFAAAEQMERELLRRGDDGVLEYLRDESEQRASLGENQWRIVGDLARALLERRLYKPIGQYSERSMADRLYEKFGPNDDAPGPNRRRADLEREAASYAGLDETAVLVWVPKPSMLLKAAEVLCDDGTKIATLASIDKDRDNRGAEIYTSHEKLWGVRVFVTPDVEESIDRRVVLAKVGEMMGGLDWDGGSPSIPNLAAERVAASAELTLGDLPQLVTLAESLHGAESSFAGLQASLEGAWIAAEAPVQLSDVWVEWSGSDETRYVHSELSALVSGADGKPVTLDGESYRTEALDGIRELNLALWLRDLEDFTDVPEAHRIVRDAIREDVSAVYDKIQPPTSAPARRGRAGNPNPVTAAIETAFVEIAEQHGKLV